MVEVEKIIEPNKELYEKLGIELARPEGLMTKQGFMIFPTNRKRANAWICAFCGATPYADFLYTKAELEGKEEFEETVSLNLFMAVSEKEPNGRELSFHTKCAEELGIFSL